MSLLSRTFATALLLAAAWAQALELAPYSAQALSAAQQAGQPVALHFHADWCPTCRKQQQVFGDLRQDAGLALTILVANYDTEKALRQQLGVRSQSTLIVYRGQQETARLVGDTSAAGIRRALQSAL